MLRLPDIIHPVPPENWLMAVALHDTNCHVLTVPGDRCFLRFAFQGQALEFKDLKDPSASLSSTTGVLGMRIRAALSLQRHQDTAIFRWMAPSTKEQAIWDTALNLYLLVNSEKSLLILKQATHFNSKNARDLDIHQPPSPLTIIGGVYDFDLDLIMANQNVSI